MMQKKLNNLPKRVVCMTLAMVMALSTALTGCGSQAIIGHALEDHGHDHEVSATVSDETVSLREILADNLDDDFADQAAVLSDDYWENDVPADEDAVINEYAINEGIKGVSDYDTGSSVDIDKVNAATIEKNFDENGLRQTGIEIKVMYTTVDAGMLTEDNITDMWNNNYDAFISNYNMYQTLYEAEGYNDCYVAFLDYGALNGIESTIISADFTRGTEYNPIDMKNNVVFDKETGVLYVPKAWCFAGDGTEVGLDLSAQVMVAVDLQNNDVTDEHGNLIANISVNVENDAGIDTLLTSGKYSMLAYDFAVLPLFAPGNVADLDSDDIEVYINGSVEPYPAELICEDEETGEKYTETCMTYNPDTGNLTIRTTAMTISEIRIVFPKKTILQSMSNIFSIGDAKAAKLFVQSDTDGMVMLYNVTTGEICQPAIETDKLTVGDVFAYESIGDFGEKSAVYKAVVRDMFESGQKDFVYTAKGTFWDGDSNLSQDENNAKLAAAIRLRSNIYWTLTGNKDLDTIKNANYVLNNSSTILRHGFLIEFPFSSDKKNVKNPVLIKTSGTKLTPGSSVYFGDQESWKWTDKEYTGDAKGVLYNYSAVGQCSHTTNSKYQSGEIRINTPGDPDNCCDCCRVCFVDECKGGDCSKCGDCEVLVQCPGGENCICPDYPDYMGGINCDPNCEECNESTGWITDVAGLSATASARILAMGEDYILLGLAQLDSGQSQRGTTVIKVKTTVKLGVTKTSTSTINDGTTGNSCYAPLSDSEYTIYNDANLTTVVGTVRGDGEDYIQVPRGTYWIQETRAPKGYWIDPQIHEVEITENTWFELSDDPMDDPFRTKTMVQKSIGGRESGDVTGDITSLAGIQFDVSYYKGEYSTIASLPATADEHAVFQTDASGVVSLDQNHMVPNNTWKYRGDLNALVFPLGTVLVKEKSTIAGLKISNTAGLLFTITDDSDKTNTNITPLNYTTKVTIKAGGSSGSDNISVVYENASVKGGVTVWKADADWERSDYQGDAPLTGAEFTIYNRGNGSVNYKGTIYNKDAAIGKITTVWDATANAYVATTGNNVLEYGTYEIRETKAPTGYKLADWSRTFTIRNDGEMHNFKQSANTDINVNGNWLHRWCADGVMRGGVAFGKVDRETKQYTNPTTTSLAGAKFQLVNKSQHPICIKGTDYAKDAVIMEFTTAPMTINGKNIIGSTTGNYVLPYGTYQLKEISSGVGYLCDTNSKNMQAKTFSIRSDGQMVYYTDESQAFHNQAQREDWYFQKKADDSGKEMVKVAWTVTSVTTGETHVIVTDENGIYNSENPKHNVKTNSNDPDSPITNGAVGINEDGEYYVKDSSKLDYDAGTWFTGYAPNKVKWANNGQSYTMVGGNGTVVSVNNALRAYPYDTYVVQELACDANEGYNLVSFMVHLKDYSDNQDDNGLLLDYGTIDDQHVDIYTSLGYNATGFEAAAKSIPETNNVEVTDVITYAGLTTGGEYTMRGQLHLVNANGKDEGIVATNEMTFDAKATGQLKMTFNVNASTYAEKKLVATEQLYQGDTLLAEETDITNMDQTVWVSGITATRADKIYTTTKTGSPVTVTDEVDWVNLEIGTVYTLTLTLVDPTSGTVLKDMNGDDIKAEQLLIPGANSGTEYISVTFPQPEGFAGTTAVVFEEISKGTVYGLHKDLKDKNQTVSFIDMIDTYAVNAETLSKEISADPGQSIYEAISLKDMRSDTTYKLEGTPYWFDEDGNAIAVLDSEGNPVTITIDDPGTEEVMIFEDIDASKLGGKDIVIYQTLWGQKNGSDEWTIAFEHYESDDEDQTIHVPKIDTTMLAENGIHNTDAYKDLTSLKLTDRVDYENLIPGQTYTMTGTLHIRDDAEVVDGFDAVDMGQVESLVSEVEFTPADKNGSVDIVFSFDASKLDGKVVVAFEECYTNTQHQIPAAWASYFKDGRAGGNRLVAHHEEIADIPQSVGLARITETELAGENIYTKIMNGVITVIETVKWDGLVPGHVYDINEVFEDAEEDTKYQISTDGTFTPDTVAGSISVSVTRDVQTEIRKNTLLAKDNIVVIDEVKYEGLIPGFTYDLVSSLMVKNENGTMNEDPLVTIRGSFIPKSVNGSVYATFMFDASSLAGKTLVAYEKIYYDDILVAAHEDPNDEKQTVRFPKLDTFFEGVDLEDNVEEPIKTIHFQFYSGHQDVFGVGQLQVPTIDIVDTITYTNVIPGSEYVLKGEVHLKSNYNELHDFIRSELDMGTLYCDQEVTFKPDKSSGTLQVVYHVIPVGITAADLVCYEYLFEDEGLVAKHADITSEPQTVTILGTNAATGLDTVLSGTEEVISNNPEGTIETSKTTETSDTVSGNDVNVTSEEITTEESEPAEESAAKEPIKTVKYYMYGGHKDKVINLVDTVTYRNLVIGSEYTLKGEIHLKNRYGGDMGIVAFGDDVKFTPEATDGTINVNFTVDPADFDDADFDSKDVQLVAFEYLYKDDELIMSHAKIRDMDQTVTIAVKDDPITIDTKLFGIKIDAPGEDSSVTETTPDISEGTGETIPGDDGIAVVSNNAEVEDTNGTEKADTNESDNTSDDDDRIEVGESHTYKELVKEVEFNVYDGEDEFGRPTQKADMITLIDKVSYKNLTPGKEYRLEGEIHARGRFGLDLGNMDINETVKFTPETSEGIVEVMFKLDPKDIRKATLVAYEYLYEGDSDKIIASHADIMDEDQTVGIQLRGESVEPGDLVTELLGYVKPVVNETVSGNTVSGNTVSGNDVQEPDRTSDATTEPEEEETKEVETEPEPVKVINFDRHVTEEKSGNLKAEADTITLVDTVNYTNLTPGTEYTMKGEIHIKDLYGRDMGTVSKKEITFTPDKVYGTVEVVFDIIPDDTNITELVAFEYLYEGEELVKSHEDIHDEDQTVVVAMNGNPCGCDNPDCKHKDERDHCLKPGCCNDTDCCEDCEQCKHKNPCGCDDPDCKHKDEKDYCKKPGCCEKDDCCKDCIDCKKKNTSETKYKNPCGCTDKNCKHKDEKDHCLKSGCCNDANCCTNCTQCKDKTTTKVNDCGCSDSNCKYKNVKDHCKKAGCCDDADCCKNCTQCKGTSNKGNNSNSNNNGSGTGNGNMSTTTKNPVKQVIEAIKTGENTFLLVGILGLLVMSGGGYVFFTKTANGRRILKKICDLLRRK